MSATRIDLHDDVLDLRDLAARLDEFDQRARSEDWPLDDDENAEYAALLDLSVVLLRETGSNLADRADDEPTMVNDDYWRQYAEQYFDDVNYHIVQQIEQIDYVSIDYDGFARDLQMDYTLVTFDGEDYWVRVV